MARNCSNLLQDKVKLIADSRLFTKTCCLSSVLLVDLYMTCWLYKVVFLDLHL